MNRILVGGGRGPAAANALERAVRLAAGSGATIRLVHAIDGARDAEAANVTEAEARIMAEELGLAPAALDVRIVAGEPGRVIVEEADRFDADLVVLGAHGEIRFRDALFGTTASHVVRHAGRPVLIARTPAHRPYARLLVAIDDPMRSDGLIDAIDRVASGAELYAFHAFDPHFPDILLAGAARTRDRARIAHDIKAWLAATGRLEPGKAHVIIGDGEPLRAIMDETRVIHPDLLVMGTRGRAYLESKAVDTVYWSPADLLVVPEQERVFA